MRVGNNFPAFWKTAECGLNAPMTRSTKNSVPVTTPANDHCPFAQLESQQQN